MQKKFIYNTKTHTLHITGYCRHAHKSPCDTHILEFDTEDEVLAYDGRAVGLCKLCQKKREQLEKEKN